MVVKSPLAKMFARKNMEEEMAKLDEISNEEGLKYHKA